MPLEPEATKRVLERRLDPAHALRSETLAGAMLGDAAPGGGAGGMGGAGSAGLGPQDGAIHHIHAMDPRARLQQAADALHGGRDEVATPPARNPDGARMRGREPPRTR